MESAEATTKKANVQELKALVAKGAAKKDIANFMKRAKLRTEVARGADKNFARDIAEARKRLKKKHSRPKIAQKRKK